MFNKSYGSEAEKKKRGDIYEANVEKYEALEGRTKYKANVTSLSDRTEKELERL